MTHLIPQIENPLHLVIGLLWFCTAVLDYLGHLYFIQLKEYRWDRFVDFLRSGEGRKTLFEYPYFWRAIIALVLFVIFLRHLPLFELFILLMLFDTVALIYAKFKRGLRRPVMTKKILLILLLVIFFEWYVLRTAAVYQEMMPLAGARFFLLALSVLAVKIPTGLYKRFLMFLAAMKLRRFKRLTVIGITGSYGKTTTKEFLADMLSTKKRVIRTPENINSEIGIALFILRTDFTDTDIFVVEIGAYRIGEIATACRMVRPNIGILTAINEQHLSLFGSIRNTQRAKYELLRAVPQEGLVIVNSDNPYCREFLHELPATVQTYGFDEEQHPTFLIHEIEARRGGLCFRGIIGQEDYRIEASFMGEHIALNIAPCVLVARHIGFTHTDIVHAAAALRLPRNVLSVYRYGSARILDDSHNSNPDGFKAALDVLSKYPSEIRRVVITRGMLELGPKSDELHEMIGGAIAYAADELVLIKKDFLEPIQAGLVEKYHTDLRVIDSDAALLAYIRSLKDKNVVVLLENTIYPKSYTEIQSERTT